MLRNNKLKNNKGFTLVEMLVSIAVFMIVMTVAVGSLVSIIDANRKAQAVKNVVNNINFALESISKDMRVGKEYDCYDSLNPDYKDCSSGSGGTGVSYFNGSGQKVFYRFVATPVIGAGNIQRCVNIPGNNCLYTNDTYWESLTAPVDNVNITKMNFYVFGTGTYITGYSGERKQPRVLITLEGTSGEKDNIKTKFNIQTTVSQRIKEFAN